MSIGFRSPSTSPSLLGKQRVVELQPEDVRAYLERQDAEQLIQTIKFYKRDEQGLQYREAWIDGENVVEHFGRYGETGSTLQHAAPTPHLQREAMFAIAATARADGFEPIPDERLVGLLVSTQITGSGTRDDLRRRHALEDYLNELTGWRGLGHCDGGSIGSGSMEAFCLVVDYEIAAAVIERELAASPFKDFIVSHVSQ